MYLVTKHVSVQYQDSVGGIVVALQILLVDNEFSKPMDIVEASPTHVIPPHQSCETFGSSMVLTNSALLHDKNKASREVEYFVVKVHNDLSPEPVDKGWFASTYNSIVDEVYEKTKVALYKLPDVDFHTGGIVSPHKEEPKYYQGNWENIGKPKFSMDYSDYSDIVDASPITNLRKSCPALNSLVDYPKGTAREGMNSRLEDVIIFLNDTERWTREQIADWLESLDINLEVTMEES